MLFFIKDPILLFPFTYSGLNVLFFVFFYPPRFSWSSKPWEKVTASLSITCLSCPRVDLPHPHPKEAPSPLFAEILFLWQILSELAYCVICLNIFAGFITVIVFLRFCWGISFYKHFREAVECLILQCWLLLFFIVSNVHACKL